MAGCHDWVPCCDMLGVMAGCIWVLCLGWLGAWPGAIAGCRRCVGCYGWHAQVLGERAGCHIGVGLVSHAGQARKIINHLIVNIYYILIRYSEPMQAKFCCF